MDGAFGPPAVWTVAKTLPLNVKLVDVGWRKRQRRCVTKRVKPAAFGSRVPYRQRPRVASSPSVVLVAPP